MTTTKSSNWWEEGSLSDPSQSSQQVEMIETDSSFVKAIGYDGEDLLRVSLRGELYEYFGVEEETFKKFLEADSKGSFYHKKIKGQYNSVKLDDN